LNPDGYTSLGDVSMNDPVYKHLVELSWRRRLTEAETAQLNTWLRAHPEAQAEWDVEAGLNHLLQELPGPEVSSNFTSRVLAAVAREQSRPERRPSKLALLGNWRRRWLPRAALAALMVGAGVLSYHKGMAARRAEMMRSVQTVVDVSSMPSAEVLTNFDAIRALPAAPSLDAPADDELLLLFR
jgi:hypothetical protein